MTIFSSLENVTYISCMAQKFNSMIFYEIVSILVNIDQELTDVLNEQNSELLTDFKEVFWRYLVKNKK